MRKPQEIIDALRAEAPMVFNTLYGDTMKEAADIIEAALADMKIASSEICTVCVHGQPSQKCDDSDFSCSCCKHECACKNCKNDNLFEWRGVQKGGPENE